MAEMKLDIDLGPMIQEGMIESVAAMVHAVPQFRFAVILRLLKTDPITRAMLAEEFGERVVELTNLGDEDTSWDEIMVDALNSLADTPGGRGDRLDETGD